MVSSKPSRRMVSISTPSCSSPRPETSKLSASSLSFTRIATLPSVSLKRRSRIWREVTFLPSRPPSGPSLMRKVMLRVGGSTGMAGSGSVTSGEAMVSGMVASDRPAMAMMSPACTSSTGTRSRPEKVISLVRRPVSTTVPSWRSTRTGMFTLAVPCSMRPVRMRPRKLSASRIEAFMAKGLSRSTFGAGTWLRIRSNIGDRSLRGPSIVRSAQPWRPEANMVWKSSCSSVAPRAAKRSKTSLCTSSGRASWRSTLLMTTIGFSPRASALVSTNLVCGSGPSAASQSTMAPSTMERMRSTSPPKSAWPGVSTMLILTPFHSTAVDLARMVMPRSRSRSLRSRARSATAWLARKAPACFSRLSTSVVLPWSTCAMIATLRSSMSRDVPVALRKPEMPRQRHVAAHK